MKKLVQTMLRQRHICLLVTVLATGCGDRVPRPYTIVRQPQSLTESDAGMIVTNLIRTKNIKLEEYQPPSITFDSARHEWSFSYQMKPPGMPGGHFSITVDATGETYFIGGA